MNTRPLVRQLSIVLALMALAGVAEASVIDQTNPQTSTGLATYYEFQQQVTAGIGGLLDGIELYTTLDGIAETDLVSIGVGSGFFTGAYAFSAPATVEPGGTYIDTSAAGIFLTPGEKFVIDVTDPEAGTCCNLGGAFRLYAGGDLWIDQSGDVSDFSVNGISMAFETFMDPNATEPTGGTPEPGTLALFGGGILGLAWMRRKTA